MPAAPNYTCILLHGLFFMTFKNHSLIATTPKSPDHTFGYRPHGTANLGPLPAGAPNIDWTNVGLKDNSSSPEKFPQSILQFSANDTGTGELLPPGNSAYEFQLKLNRPYEIYAFRPSSLGAFSMMAKPQPPKGNGKKSIRDSVISSCGTTGTNPAALLVGLVYERDATCTLPNVLSFYAEHQMKCSDIDAMDVNMVLTAAQELFASPADFDLQFVNPPQQVPPVVPPDMDAYGVVKNDELSICELYVGGGSITIEGVNPINCAQFGVNG
jgi:hypothetical protein